MIEERFSIVTGRMREAQLMSGEREYRRKAVRLTCPVLVVNAKAWRLSSVTDGELSTVLCVWLRTIGALADFFYCLYGGEVHYEPI